MPEEHLRFSPSILARLGEELVPYPDQGVLELVRNAYDADATLCTVELENVTRPGGILRITDDGDGMSSSDIRSGWLILGKSSKTVESRTKRGRRPVGDKGLGRLGALRLGSVATLRTRPRTQVGVEFAVELDWARFDASDVVESVPLTINTKQTDAPPGTSIEVANLRRPLAARDVRRLARSLLLLSDPFDSEHGFKAILKAPAYRDLERLVQEAYFDQAEFHLQARLDSSGTATATVTDWRGAEIWTAVHQDIARGDKLYRTVPLSFDFWAFNLDSANFATRSVSFGEVRSWLRVVGGVHVYDRTLRVAPYGDPCHDWLDLNLHRARSPEHRPSTNNSIGRVAIGSHDQHQLVQKTDRSGFIEDEAFTELRTFLVDSLEWLARQRGKSAETKRRETREQAPAALTSAQQQLKAVTAALPDDQRLPVEQAVRRFEQAQDRQLRSVREDLFLYRALATVGTTAAVFAHESAKPAQDIMRMANTVSSRAKRLLASEYSGTLEAPLSLIVQAAQALKTFSGLPLFLLARDKRRPGVVDIGNTTDSLVAAFRPVLKEEGVELVVSHAPGNPRIYASTSALESILTNFITNSVKAFKSDDFSGEERQIAIRTELSGNGITIRFMDSGPGVTTLDIDDIWLPGRTSAPDGTGLGLTIVRDSVRDLGGTVSALARGELGGAEFIVELPTIGE